METRDEFRKVRSGVPANPGFDCVCSLSVADDLADLLRPLILNLADWLIFSRLADLRACDTEGFSSPKHAFSALADLS